MAIVGHCISLNLNFGKDLSFIVEIMIDFLAQIYQFLSSFISAEVFLQKKKTLVPEKQRVGKSVQIILFIKSFFQQLLSCHGYEEKQEYLFLFVNQSKPFKVINKHQLNTSFAPKSTCLLENLVYSKNTSTYTYTSVWI